MSSNSAEYTVAVIRDLVSRYAVDGVHLDYIRYPNEEFDYSRGALEAFRADVSADLNAADRRRYDDRLRREPLIYTQAFPVRWRAFRMAQLTRLLTAIRAAVKEKRPAALISAAVIPDAVEAADRRLQDWGAWVNAGLLDVVCPMAYTTDSALFGLQIAAARDAAGARRVWAGIGAYRLPAAQIAAHVRHARSLGVSGVVFFSYDSLIDSTGSPAYLTELGRSAFMPTRQQ
jgi:uncharacterized lipoprotein YddW (UPF0748 family)